MYCIYLYIQLYMGTLYPYQYVNCCIIYMVYAFIQVFLCILCELMHIDMWMCLFVLFLHIIIFVPYIIYCFCLGCFVFHNFIFLCRVIGFLCQVFTFLFFFFTIDPAEESRWRGTKALQGTPSRCLNGNIRVLGVVIYFYLCCITHLDIPLHSQLFRSWWGISCVSHALSVLHLSAVVGSGPILSGP